MQLDVGIGVPGIFAMVDDKNSRQELDFVSKKLECQCAREKCRVHEQAFAERHIVRDWLGLTEAERRRATGAGRGVAGKIYFDIGEPEGRLFDDNTWWGSRFGDESDEPGTFAIAAVFNGAIGNKVDAQRDNKGEGEVFDRII
jgi:hypothetical protein